MFLLAISSIREAKEGYKRLHEQQQGRGHKKEESFA